MKAIMITMILGVSLAAACKGPGADNAKAPHGNRNVMAANEPQSKCDGDYAVVLKTTAGDIAIDVHHEWAPLGARRFCELVSDGYYSDVAFFRVIDGFMAQAGIHGDPATNARWRQRRIKDDPVNASNSTGTVSFATGGPNTRTTQFFINLADNARLDAMGFAPFGEVRDMVPVKALYAGYGEGAPRGKGPSQQRLQTQGNAYLKASFPRLDYIVSARVVDPRDPNQ